MLTGWLSCLYCLPQASIVVKLLLNNFFYSPLFQVYLVAEEKVVAVICSLFSLLLSPVSCCSLTKGWITDHLFSFLTHINTNEDSLVRIWISVKCVISCKSLVRYSIKIEQDETETVCYWHAQLKGNQSTGGLSCLSPTEFKLHVFLSATYMICKSPPLMKKQTPEFCFIYFFFFYFFWFMMVTHIFALIWRNAISSLQRGRWGTCFHTANQISWFETIFAYISNVHSHCSVKDKQPHWQPAAWYTRHWL